MTQPVTLITGAAGFIGSHLTDHLLDQDQPVVGLDDFSGADERYPRATKERNLHHALGADHFTLVDHDICDEDQLDRTFQTHQPATVVHLAARAGVRPSIADPAEYARVNITGLVNLLQAAVKHKVKRFIFASSSSVYGNSTKQTGFEETDRVDHPISPYAATKKAGELICHTYCHLHKLPITCLRFFTVYGPRQRPDLAIHKFMKLIAAGEPIPMFGDGTTKRDYTFVSDIIQGIRAAMDTCTPDSGYRVFNLGHDEPVALRQMIDTIAQVVGKPARIDQQPMQPGDVQQTHADISLSRSKLGYSPQTSFEEGVQQQWAWMERLGSGG